MKIRYGFVSNSSSYSFVLVVSVKDHVAAMNGLPPEDQALMLIVMQGIKPCKVAGEEVMVIDGGDYADTWSRGAMNDDDCPTLQDKEGEAYYAAWEKATEFWTRYTDLLPKDNIVYNWSDG